MIDNVKLTPKQKKYFPEDKLELIALIADHLIDQYKDDERAENMLTDLKSLRDKSITIKERYGGVYDT